MSLENESFVRDSTDCNLPLFVILFDSFDLCFLIDIICGLTPFLKSCTKSKKTYVWSLHLFHIIAGSGKLENGDDYWIYEFDGDFGPRTKYLMERRLRDNYVNIVPTSIEVPRMQLSGKSSHSTIFLNYCKTMHLN